MGIRQGRWKALGSVLGVRISTLLHPDFLEFQGLLGSVMQENKSRMESRKEI